MPGVDGFEAARQILARDPDARIVFVTGHGDAALLDRGMSLGGLGFVTKLAAGEGLVPAVRAVLRGERAVSGVPSVAGRPARFEQ
jgi:DNA-binding NarL/FixJ family response regulator